MVTYISRPSGANPAGRRIHLANRQVSDVVQAYWYTNRIPVPVVQYEKV